MNSEGSFPALVVGLVPPAYILQVVKLELHVAETTCSVPLPVWASCGEAAVPQDCIAQSASHRQNVSRRHV